MKLLVCFLSLSLAGASLADTVRKATEKESSLFCRAIQAQYRSYNLEMGIDEAACRKVEKETLVQNTGKRIISAQLNVQIEGDEQEMSCSVAYAGTPIRAHIINSRNHAFCQTGE